MNTLKLNHNSGQIIGFASEFYTLWNVDCIPYYDSQGRLAGYNWRGCFIKNISKDINKVRALFPDLEIDETLHGSRSFTYFERIKEVFPDYQFGFGKYKGRHISQCKDIEYLLWAWNGYLTAANKVYAAAVLTKAGYHIINNKVYSPEQYACLLEYQAFETTIKNGEPFDVLFESSLNGDGQYLFRGQVLCFNDFKRYDYKGYEYALPIIKGSPKRIKGKMFHVTDYSISDNGILITNMGITK